MIINCTATMPFEHIALGQLPTSQLHLHLHAKQLSTPNIPFCACLRDEISPIVFVLPTWCITCIWLLSDGRLKYFVSRSSFIGLSLVNCALLYFISIYLHLFIYLSIYSFIYLFVYMSINLFVYFEGSSMKLFFSFAYFNRIPTKLKLSCFNQMF